MTEVKDEASGNEALEALFVDEPDLERLEVLLQQFNIFEALGAVRVELRHSDFLAFLMSPQQNHGLGDVFLKGFLQRAIEGAERVRAPLSRIRLDLLDLEHATILREWENVDILIQDEEHRLAVAIENKVGGTEHSEQLTRYRRTVEGRFPSWTHVFVFLTPEGDPPTDDRWIAMDYRAVCALAEDFVETRSSALDPGVITLLKHYAQMLRRHVVSESEIADLCARLYRKHQRALDLIFEFRPDRQASVRDLLEEVIAGTPGVILDHTSKSYILFVPEEWDTPKLREGHGWTQSGRILMFEFANMVDGLRLKLIIGPGPELIRRQLFERST